MDFLALNDVQVAKSTLHGFIKRRTVGIGPAVQKKVFSETVAKKQKEFMHFNPPAWADPATKINDLI